MPTITLSIGLTANDTLSPLPTREARAFVRDVRNLLSVNGATVYVDAARSTGQWQDEATGETVRESSRTFVAELPDAAPVLAALPHLARTYRQDAIAATVGRTHLVAAE